MKIEKSNYKLVINQYLMQKLNKIISAINYTEWSGHLLYRIKSGSIEQNNLTLEAVDLILMDIGSSAYTEFDTGDELSDYMFDNDMMDGNTYAGLLHSHHSMAKI